jgi:flagellar M-ring protein FliF
VDSLKTLASQLGRTRLAIMAGAAMLVLGGLMFMAVQASKPTMGYLYTDLDPQSASAIVDKLRGMNVPFEAAADGRSIKAPESRLGELRMALAGEQLGGPVGYELLDKQDILGTTNFMQQVNHLRALEGELARSIETIDMVQTARVHLVVPQEQLFQQEKRDPSGSITLHTRGQLPTSKVNAIRYLVSSAVPGLQPGHISVVDQTGTLLARADDSGEGGLGDSINEKQTATEQRLRSQIESMLERIVGAGRVRAEVSAELEAAEVREQAEVYDPDKQVLARSTTVEKTDENKSQEATTGGPVSVSTNLPENQQSQSGEGAGTQSASGETSEQLDYQNSKTMTTTVRSSGAIKRLSVAVLVDGNYVGESGTKQTYAARTPAELEQFKTLVKNAVGFDEERGDTVEVVNLRFAANDASALEEKAGSLPLGLTPGDIGRIAQTGLVLLALLVIIFTVVRPLMKAGRASASNDNDALPQLEGPGERLAIAPPDKDMMAELLSRAAAGDEDAIAILEARRENGGLAIESEIDVAQIEGRLKSAAVRKVGEVINRNPQEAAAVVRQWMNG